MINQKQSVNSYLFVLGILLLSFSNIFAISGYANYIFYTELATVLTFVAVVSGISINREKKQVSKWDITLVVICFTYLLLMLFEWRTFYQLTNLVTLFGIFAWVGIFSKIHWDAQKYAACGIACSIYSVIMVYLFLPGGILSGWNENSPICVLPVAFFAITCLIKTEKSWGIAINILFVILLTSLILQLENRSAFFALMLFLVCCLFKKVYTNRQLFRVFYIVVISFNLLLPLFFDIATSTAFFQRVSKAMLEFFDKNGLNGREELWELAVIRVRQNPLFGSLGYRTTYFHNFSLDILTQFGWVGWIVFFTALIYILEKSFEPHKKSNLFLIGFLCLIFLNTFESVLFCNNYFMPFSYLLLGMCWHKPKENELERLS